MCLVQSKELLLRKEDKDTRKKTVKISIRLPARLYEMLETIQPLFNFEITDTIVHILKYYENSPDHQEQLLKLSRAHFVALWRKWEIEENFKELKSPQE